MHDLTLLQRHSWIHIHYFNVEICDARFQVWHRARQRRECVEVHRNYDFRLEQSTGVSGFARAHGEDVAHGQTGDIRRVELADDGHVPEYIRIASVVELHSVREGEHVSASFAAVDDLSVVLDAAAMVGVDHGD